MQTWISNHNRSSHWSPALNRISISAAWYNYAHSLCLSANNWTGKLKRQWNEYINLEATSGVFPTVSFVNSIDLFSFFSPWSTQTPIPCFACLVTSKSHQKLKILSWTLALETTTQLGCKDKLSWSVYSSDAEWCRGPNGR